MGLNCSDYTHLDGHLGLWRADEHGKEIRVSQKQEKF